MTDYIDRGQKIEVQFLPKIKLHCTYRFYNYVSETVTVFADVYCNMWFDNIEYLRNIKHCTFFRVGIQVYKHEWKLEGR